MKLQYKYKIRQIVEYKISEYKENVCPTCSSIIEEETEKKVSGEIIKREYRLIINIQDLNSLCDNKVNVPYRSNLNVENDREEPYYTIKRKTGEKDSIHEDFLKEIKI